MNCVADVGGDQQDTPLDRGRALVSAALATIADLQVALPRLEKDGAPAKGDLLRALERASMEGVNLLKAKRAGDAPPLLASLARGSGEGQLHAGVLALDPAVLTLSAGDESGPLDGLLVADDDEIAEAVRRLRHHLDAAASALSVAAARLDLQARFVERILEEERGEATAPPEDYDAAGAREAALAVGALLSARPLAIATGNRKALETLFASMSLGGAAA